LRSRVGDVDADGEGAVTVGDSTTGAGTGASAIVRLRATVNPSLCEFSDNVVVVISDGAPPGMS
jgi:hypothetical protein